MKKAKKITKKALTGGLIWTLVAAIFTGYMLYHILTGLSPAMETGVAVNATERFTVSFDAYIMRNETVLTSENTGFCDYLVGDTDYSKDEAELARVYSSGGEDVAKKIKEIDAEISLLRECARLANAGNTKEAVMNAYRELTFALGTGDVRGSSEMLDGLLRDMYLLEHNTGTSDKVIADRIESSQNRIEELVAERSSLCASLGSYESVVADGTGNFFHGVDGYEEIYSSAGIDTMAVDDFLEMISSEPKSYEGAIGSFVFGTDYKWYIAMPARLEDIPHIFTLNQKDNSDPEAETPDRIPDNIGKKYSVNFKYTSGDVLEMTYERLVTDDDSDVRVLVFSSATLPDGFDRARCQTVEIQTAEYSGYRISNKAIYNIDGADCIYILKNGRVTKRRVEVLCKNEIYSIVKTQDALALQYSDSQDYENKRAEFQNTYAALNDVYFMSDKGLYEGKLID